MYQKDLGVKVIKDSDWEIAPSNKSPTLSKSMNIYTFGLLVNHINSSYEVLKLKQNFRKNKILQILFFVIDPFCTSHSTNLKIGF